MEELFSQGVTMTHSGIFTRNKKKVVHVCFERKDPVSFAEIVLPDGAFLKCQGFSEDEKQMLKLYAQSSQEQIFQRARELNNQVFFKL